MLELPPLSLYVHIPWCVKKCPYCDFNSHTDSGGLPESAYVSALINDLHNDAEFAQGRKLISIFFGGGTPSLFSATSIATIIDAAEEIVGIADGAEITLEANPGTFEQEKFSGYKHAGVNRLSIGIQSFDDQHLKALGRIHGANESIQAVATARQAGFDNINLDLMHGLPDQNPAKAQADIEQAIRLQPEHISWYQLTIEPNTVFYSRPPTLPDEPWLEAIQDNGLATLQAAGFEQYEVSAFAKPNHQAAHNINYWQFGDYLGIGAGAHGKITLTGEQQIIRSQKTRLPGDYLSRDTLSKKINFLANTRALGKEDLAVEFFMNALRLNQGVPKNFFEQRTGQAFEYISKIWTNLEHDGLVQAPGKSLMTTPRGQQFLDSVLARF